MTITFRHKVSFPSSTTICSPSQPFQRTGVVTIVMSATCKILYRNLFFSIRTTSLASKCNLDCHCSQYKYLPVCGSDGITYHSPCYAGCKATNRIRKVVAYMCAMCVMCVTSQCLMQWRSCGWVGGWGGGGVLTVLKHRWGQKGKGGGKDNKHRRTFSSAAPLLMCL